MEASGLAGHVGQAVRQAGPEGGDGLAIRDAAMRQRTALIAWSARCNSPCSTSSVEESAQMKEGQCGHEPAKSLEMVKRSVNSAVFESAI